MSFGPDSKVKGEGRCERGEMFYNASLYTREVRDEVRR
jgi:hypothetical protein